MSLLLILVVGIGLMWLMSRPQRKQLKEQQMQLAAVQPGDRVLLQSGVYCTVREVGDRQLIVEYAPGVDVPVLKQTMVRKVAEGEEEFQFDDQIDPIEGVEEFQFDEQIDPIEGVDAIDTESFAEEPAVEEAEIEELYEDPAGEADKPAGAPDFVEKTETEEK